MNAVEIEEAVSSLAEQPFDPATFPYAFLEAFGNKATTIQRLRSGSSNKSDVEGGVLQYNNIHIAVAPQGKVAETLTRLRESPATSKQKAKFVLATDGNEFQAEDLTSDAPPVVCEYKDFPDHFGFFLPLAGISTVKQIRESSFDIKATGRLNRLYVELLKDNPKWGTKERRHDMNHFMARLIFCFFAEDTDIFKSGGLFSKTVAQMSEKDSSNTHEIIGEIFRAMNTKPDERAKAKLPRWVDDFPYVNGGLFSGSLEVPRLSKIARSYLLHIGNLEWKKINPDIFGSMIQAVAEDEERGALGMHYTSVPNILRVLNPLFLDDLRAQLEKAGDNSRMLLNLRKRISKIRVFDPACGSGNFLVIAYKQMREIEAEINRRRGEPDARTEIQLTNFRGIELRDFPAEIARLALIIAEYQCDVLYRGQKEALLEFLPLDAENWITCGNALEIDWLPICLSAVKEPRAVSERAGNSSVESSEGGSESAAPETYVCGNPPYLGSTWQSSEQKAEVRRVVGGRTSSPGFLDYVSGWFLKAADIIDQINGGAAFVSTKSICQGQSVPILWPILLDSCEITFAYSPFKWANLAQHNAGVTVVIVGLGRKSNKPKRLFEGDEDGGVTYRSGASITPYLTIGLPLIVEKKRVPMSDLAEMEFGNKPSDGGNLLLFPDELPTLGLSVRQREEFIREVYGSSEFINGDLRYCIWIPNERLAEAERIEPFLKRIEAVRELRLNSRDKGAQALAKRPHQFKLMRSGASHTIVVPAISSENRDYLPCGLLGPRAVVTNKIYALYDAPLWNMAIIASRLHWVWVGTVCSRLEMRFSYSNTLGWNTFPVPKLTEKNKADLTHCAEDILIAREAHFPATISDLYEPGDMPEDLRRAHERNDEVLERIYVGRRFKNDSERLEKLFDLYTKMTAAEAKAEAKSKRGRKSSPKSAKKEARA